MRGATKQAPRHKSHLPALDGSGGFLCKRNMDAVKELSSAIHNVEKCVWKFLNIEDRRCICNDCLRLYALHEYETNNTYEVEYTKNLHKLQDSVEKVGGKVVRNVHNKVLTGDGKAKFHRN
jgi:hypothetical protein